MTQQFNESGGPQLFQYSLRFILAVLSLICAVSVVVPWTGIVLAAYSPAIAGFLVFRYAESVDDDAKRHLGIGLMAVGYMAGSLLLGAFANLVKG